MRPSALLLACLTSLALACGGSNDAPGPTCQNPIGASEAPAGSVQHFANVRVGTTLPFNVPVNTASITIVEQAVSAPETISYQAAGRSAQSIDNTAVPYTVKDQAGNLIYNDNPATPVTDLAPDAIANLPAFFATSAPATGTLTIPNTTGGLALVGNSGLPAGKWQLVVSDYAYECSPVFQQAPGASCSGGSDASTYDVTVITKPLAPGGGIPTGGSIDLVVYFATTVATSASLAPLSASTANSGNDRDLNRMQQTLTALLGQLGVTVGSVRYVDLPPDVQAKYATGIDVSSTGGCSPMADLLRHGTGGNTLNVFLVSAFTNATDLPPNNEVVGLDGTIPGPATVGGSTKSGTAVATHDLRSGRSLCTSTPDFIRCGADFTAYVIAHEAGHYLGLYHVTESDGTQFDPLLDTPMCPCSSCASTPTQCATAGAPFSANSYQMSVSDCIKGTTCGGGENLMFWRLEPGSLGTLSPQQQSVIHANPLVQ